MARPAFYSPVSKSNLNQTIGNHIMEIYKINQLPVFSQLANTWVLTWCNLKKKTVRHDFSVGTLHWNTPPNKPAQVFSHKVIYHEHLNDTHAAISETNRAIFGGSPYASCSAAAVCNFWREEVDILVHKPAYPLLSPSWSISIISLEQVSAPCQGVRRRNKKESRLPRIGGYLSDVVSQSLIMSSLLNVMIWTLHSFFLIHGEQSNWSKGRFHWLCLHGALAWKWLSDSNHSDPAEGFLHPYFL